MSASHGCAPFPILHRYRQLISRALDDTGPKISFCPATGLGEFGLMSLELYGSQSTGDRFASPHSEQWILFSEAVRGMDYG
jgi:hypothetical protein